MAAATVIKLTQDDNREENTVRRRRGKRVKHAAEEEGAQLQLQHDPKRDEAQELAAIQKLNVGKTDELEVQDLTVLMSFLGTEEDGRIKLERLKYALMHYVSPPCSSKLATQLLKPAMARVGADPETSSLNDCLLSAEDVLWVLTHGRGAREFKSTHADHEDADNGEEQRQVLVDWVVKITDRHDAFMTLPITLVYMVIFVALVSSHLRIWERQQTEHALAAWVNGRNPRTDCENNVDNMESFWEWLLGEEDGIMGILAVERSKTIDGSIVKEYVLAQRNIFIGDIQLKYCTFDDECDTRWLIGSGLENDETLDSVDYRATALRGGNKALSDGFGHPDIQFLWLSFSTYNEYSKMIGLSTVRIKFEESGAVIPRIYSQVVSLDTYPTHLPLNYVWEIAFVAVVAHMFFYEAKDALLALRMGCGEFFDYWKFWNIVDWICILCGFLAIVIWGLCCAAMNDASFGNFLNQDTLKVKTDPMLLTSAEVESLSDSIKWLKRTFYALHVVMALNTVSIVTKFFKAFTSNPRLSVVIYTFRAAYSDFIHFGIIFFTIFLPFTLVGHTLFGHDVEEFSSIYSSFNTGLTVLMGDFEWYVEISAHLSESGTLPSGMPIWILAVWYVLFMFLVLLVLLNMLLAIIIEHYTSVTKQLEQETDAPEIWKQVTNYIAFRKKTRKFVTLEHLRRLLENDEQPAYSANLGRVTEETLKTAFEELNMTDEQAKYIVKELEYLEKPEDALEPSTTEVVRMLGDQMTALDEISEVVLTQKSPDKALKSLSRSVQELVSTVAKMERKMEELSAHVPKAPGAAAATSSTNNKAVSSSRTAPEEEEELASTGTAAQEKKRSDGKSKKEKRDRADKDAEKKDERREEKKDERREEKREERERKERDKGREDKAQK